MELEERKVESNDLSHFHNDDQAYMASFLYNDFANRAKTWNVDVDSLNFAERMDKEDPLRDFRKLFFYPKKKSLPSVDLNSLEEDEECIYFCGHSLGLQLKSIEKNLQNVLQNWAERGVESHFHGHLPVAFGDLPLKKNMAYLVGAEEKEIAFMNGLTVNIHIMLASFYQPTSDRHKILLVDQGFPSDLFAVQSHIRFRGYDPDKSIIFLKPRPGQFIINPKDIMSVIENEGKEIALIFLEGVHFYTGQLFDMKNITRAGHKQGCVVGFDLAHAVGNVKLQLHEWDIDFALWCTYKYMNCGAGSMASIFVHNKHTKDGPCSTMPMLRGWWGTDIHKKFEMEREFHPAEGADAFKMSNPSPFLAIMILANLEVFKEAKIENLIQKQRLLTGYLEYLLKKNFPINISNDAPSVLVITPSNPKNRGCQISFMTSMPINSFENILKQKGIVCDIRKPSVIRATPVPLYNTFREVYCFVHTLKEIFASLQHKEGNSE